LTTPHPPNRISALPRYELVRSPEGLYSTSIGGFYSVTTILDGSRDNSGLLEWRESVGEERARFICDLACFRGTNHHAAVERFLTDATEPAFDFLQTPYWKSVRPFLSTVDRPLLLEGAVWHPDGFAGTLDCLAYLTEDGDQPTLLDWKTADSIRKPAKMYEYSLQVSAYAAAANYIYADRGLQIQQAKIVVAIPDSPPQIETLNLDALEQLYRHFQARVQRFTYARSKRTRK
jgi:genome maintenance exonuclease 1